MINKFRTLYNMWRARWDLNSRSQRLTENDNTFRFSQRRTLSGTRWIRSTKSNPSHKTIQAKPRALNIHNLLEKSSFNTLFFIILNFYYSYGFIFWDKDSLNTLSNIRTKNIIFFMRNKEKIKIISFDFSFSIKI